MIALVVTFWLAAALVLTSEGPKSVSGSFSTKAECEAMQVEAVAHPSVLGVTPCIEVNIEPKKTGA